MIRSIDETTATVPPEEVARRIAEWRRVSFERRAPAIIVYLPDHHACPWPGCDRSIAAIDFQLDRLGEPARLEGWLTAWWQGAGLVGRCPGCRQFVQFGYSEKRAIAEPANCFEALLPDDWYLKAHVAPRVSE